MIIFFKNLSLKYKTIVHSFYINICQFLPLNTMKDIQLMDLPFHCHVTNVCIQKHVLLILKTSVLCKIETLQQ